MCWQRFKESLWSFAELFLQSRHRMDSTSWFLRSAFFFSFTTLGCRGCAGFDVPPAAFRWLSWAPSSPCGPWQTAVVPPRAPLAHQRLNSWHEFAQRFRFFPLGAAESSLAALRGDLRNISAQPGEGCQLAERASCLCNPSFTVATVDSPPFPA